MSVNTDPMSGAKSTLDYVIATDKQGYHFTVFSDIKEIHTAEVVIEEVATAGTPAVHVMKVP